MSSGKSGSSERAQKIYIYIYASLALPAGLIIHEDLVSQWKTVGRVKHQMQPGHLRVAFCSLQTCLDIIQASAASLPRAKSSLARTSAAHVFYCLLPQAFRGAWFTRFASASIVAKRKVTLSKVVFRHSRCRLGFKHGATLPRSFRKPSANLPQNTPAVLVFLACCWQLLFE